MRSSICFSSTSGAAGASLLAQLAGGGLEAILEFEPGDDFIVDDDDDAVQRQHTLARGRIGRHRGAALQQQEDSGAGALRGRTL